MNLCIPVDVDRGLESPVCAHFGSAPAFMIVDTATHLCRAIPNGNEHHAHGMCTPVAALLEERVEGAVVGGIGMGALRKLNAANIPVFRSEHATVAETLAAWKAGTLKILEPAQTCAGHGHGQGHGHGRS
ncbi:MAG TPA: NifB/NifX family molybdenum-iron cluster-binding protein [Anaeromyxobacter sp.]